MDTHNLGFSTRLVHAGIPEDAHGSVPAFPLDLLPAEWRRWTADTAQAVEALR